MPSLALHRLAKVGALAMGALHKPPAGLTVLLYHRIGVGDRAIDVPMAMFKEQIDWLAATTELVTLADGIARAADSTFAGVLVALTFDDGTADFADDALPVLVSHGAPATVFVATGPVEDRRAFPSWGKASDAPALTWDGLRDAVATGLVEVGSHTHTHADLDRIAPDAIADELDRSKALIEERLDRPCRHFAYPHAVTSQAAEQLVRERFETASVGGWRRNAAGRIDRLRIARVPVTRADSEVFFRAKVADRMRAEAWAYRLGGRRG